MGSGRYAPRTVEPEEQTAQPPERTAHSWELDESDSWEPVVPDTWTAPVDTDEARGGVDSAAGWTDAARTEQEWADAASTSPQTASTPAGPEDEQLQGPNPGRMVLGLATMAAQRLRGGVPAGDGFVTGVGLLQETANGLRALGARLLDPAAHAAASTMQGAASVPVAGLPVRVALRSGAKLADLVTEARSQGRQTVSQGMADAEQWLRVGLGSSLRWAGQYVLPYVAEAMSPRLVEQVVPRIVAGAVPAIREALRAGADAERSTSGTAR
jgi:hypothetical protein